MSDTIDGQEVIASGTLDLDDANEFDGHTIITAFIAALPGTASSFMLRPDGGAKLVFEIPESELENAWPIHRLHGQTFRVVIVSEGVACQ